MAAWSQLPTDIWHSIGEKVGDVAVDRIRFRSVCRLWRSVLPFPQPPWLMLAENHENPKTRGFFGLGDERLYQFEVADLYEKRILGSTGAWLITIDFEGMIELVNPLSNIHIDLPPQSTFEYSFHSLEGYNELQLTPKHHRDNMSLKVVLSSPTPSLSSSWTVMAIHYHSLKLAFARPGDASWTTVQTPKDFFNDIIFYQNQFFGINNYACLMACDLDSNPPKATVVSRRLYKRNMEHKHLFYLVEWKGELLLVTKFMDDDGKSYKTGSFEVLLFNFTNKKWMELNNLEDYSLFLGYNTSVAVGSSHYPHLRRNCIYFTDDYVYGYRGLKIPGGRDMGIFNLEDGSILPLSYQGTSTSRVSPPLWVVPPPLHRKA